LPRQASNNAKNLAPTRKKPATKSGQQSSNPAPLPALDARPDGAARRGKNPRNLYERAYEAIEERLVTCALAPGRYLAMQELQDLVQLGRTPVHLAVTRLAEETLLRVHPRRGLQIAPIDLARERVLLRLRRDVERFVIRLAAEKSNSLHRNQMLHLKRHLREHRASMTIDTFNLIDRKLDRLFLAAANEPFVEKTLQPLHTIFRRIGWLYHAQIAPDLDLSQTIDVHLLLLDAVVNCHVEAALNASDELIDFVGAMFDTLEREIDPELLDCSLQHYDAL